jgi:hypothetical protein
VALESREVTRLHCLCILRLLVVDLFLIKDGTASWGEVDRLILALSEGFAVQAVWQSHSAVASLASPNRRIGAGYLGPSVTRLGFAF